MQEFICEGMPNCCRTILARSLSSRSKSYPDVVSSAISSVASNNIQPQQPKQVEELKVVVDRVYIVMNHKWQPQSSVPLFPNLPIFKPTIKRDVNVSRYLELPVLRYFSTANWNLCDRPPFHIVSGHRRLTTVPGMDPLEIHAGVQNEKPASPECKKSRREGDEVEDSHLHRSFNHEPSESVYYPSLAHHLEDSELESAGKPQQESCDQYCTLLIIIIAN